MEITGPADNDWTVNDPPVYINPRCVTRGLEECVQEVECIAKYLEDLKEADKAEDNEVQIDIEFYDVQNVYLFLCLRTRSDQRRSYQDSVRKTTCLQELMITKTASLLSLLYVIFIL